MQRPSDTTKFTALVGVLTVSFLVALVGMCIQIAWIGKPTGREAGWVGDISAGIYTAAMIVTFALAAARQDHRAHRTAKKASH